MTMSEWAKREVEIACKRENSNREEGEFDYGCACYESALKAFNSLLEDGFEEIDYDECKTRLEIADRKREGDDE